MTFTIDANICLLCTTHLDFFMCQLVSVCTPLYFQPFLEVWSQELSSYFFGPFEYDLTTSESKKKKKR